MRTFAPVIRRALVELFGSAPWAADGEPVGRAGMAVLARYNEAAFSGSGSFPHFGARGSPYEGSYTGLVASPQTFQGSTQMGAARRAVVQDYPALPQGQAPYAVQEWLDQVTELEGGNPW